MAGILQTIFQSIYLNENNCVFIQTALMFVAEGQIDYKFALV